jgi:myo-inositol-1(or 4)-monophosphatase
MRALTRQIESMIGAARAAADSLASDFAHLARLRVEEKGPSDFVSSADLRSQEVLRAHLSAAHPDHAFLLEEGPRAETRGPTKPRFIVDPLDGTTNFLHGLPHFAISIALEVDGRVVAGVVLDPAKSELFWAAEGEGAWLGEQRLAVSTEREPTRLVIGTGIPHHGRGDHPRYLAALGNVMRDVAGIRRWGAASLDLAYVAAGRFDAFFEQGLAPWDVGAGILLVREAGGKVTRSDGGALAGPLDSGDVLASSSEPVHSLLVAGLAPLHVAAGGPTEDSPTR